MKTRLLIIFLLIVLLPLALITFLGLRLAHYEQDNLNRQLTILLTDRLNSISNEITQLLEQRRRELSEILSAAQSKDIMRSISDKNPYVAGVFLLAPKGNIIYPNPRDNLTVEELAFLQRAQDILSYDNIIDQSSTDFPPVQPSQQQTETSYPRNQQAQVIRQSVEQLPIRLNSDWGWYNWFWGQGLHIIYWQKQPDGNIIGAELERTRLLADIIELLPAEDYSSQTNLEGRIIFCNESDKSIYQWGAFEPADDDAALAKISLKEPLSSWYLKYYLSPQYAQSFQGKTKYFAVFGGVLAIAVCFIVLAAYFYRENTRQIRLAQKQVTFVNQVSHELKTPLTNIRLYAELMQNTPHDDQTKTNKYLNVIVDESRRLSRLIANILSFSKSRKDTLKLRFSPDAVDNVINSVLENFKASLGQRNIKVEFDAAAPDLVQVDSDALAQILGNLLSNVEKYAASGGYVKITSRKSGTITKITVADKGPGIPQYYCEKIFQPFNRISNKLTDGVSGTGIGLTIARELARLHGGNLVLLRGKKGAVFEITLRTQPVVAGGEK